MTWMFTLAEFKDILPLPALFLARRLGHLGQDQCSSFKDGSRGRNRPALGDRAPTEGIECPGDCLPLHRLG